MWLRQCAASSVVTRLAAEIKVAGEEGLPSFLGVPKSEIETPALLVDLDAMEHNLRRMSQFFASRKSKLRPHFKNHRVLKLAAMQMEQGAIGITCANLSQAEKLVHFGIHSVLIANEIAGEASLRRFLALSREAPVIIAVDNANVVQDLARLAGKHAAGVNVLVDIDLGLQRCGVSPGEQAVSLALHTVERGLHLKGIMGYEGHLQPIEPGPEKRLRVTQAVEALVDSKKKIEAAGIPLEVVSCGGTGDYAIAGAHEGVTEIQAGSYLLMDTWYAPFAPEFQPALSVLATVISKTPGQRIVVDSGAKALSGQRGLPSVKDFAGLRLKALHAEHALIDIEDPAVIVEVGDKIEVSVHYHDGTMQLHHRMFGIRDGKVETVFEIEH
jgi:D-serine deaminase-like pyridoxal phosphate-dependent protein